MTKPHTQTQTHAHIKWQVNTNTRLASLKRLSSVVMVVVVVWFSMQCVVHHHYHQTTMIIHRHQLHTLCHVGDTQVSNFLATSTSKDSSRSVYDGINHITSHHIDGQSKEHQYCGVCVYGVVFLTFCACAKTRLSNRSLPPIPNRQPQYRSNAIGSSGRCHHWRQWSSSSRHDKRQADIQEGDAKCVRVLRARRKRPPNTHDQQYLARSQATAGLAGSRSHPTQAHHCNRGL
jgi:hypothetical protein